MYYTIVLYIYEYGQKEQIYFMSEGFRNLNE